MLCTTFSLRKNFLDQINLNNNTIISTQNLAEAQNYIIYHNSTKKTQFSNSNLSPSPLPYNNSKNVLPTSCEYKQNNWDHINNFLKLKLLTYKNQCYHFQIYLLKEVLKSRPKSIRKQTVMSDSAESHEEFPY